MLVPHDKKTYTLFLLVTLSWSTSWFFAKMQIEFLPEELAIGYRFFLAGMILLGYAIWRKKSFRFHTEGYLLILIQALGIFSMNHLFFYNAMNYITSGVVASIFSLSILLSAVFNYLFHDIRTPKKVILGGIIGIIGLMMIFAGEIKGFGISVNAIRGLFFSLIGVTIFSVAINFTQRLGSSTKDLISKTALSMILGSLISFFVAFLKGEEFIFSIDPKYLFSLTYLIFIPGLVGFVGFLELVSRVGSSRAAYTSLICPALALIISAIFEKYHFGYSAILGLTLIIWGNYLAIRNEKTQDNGQISS